LNLGSNFKLTKNRRAVSAVISNMLLIAAVIVVGLTAFGFSQYTSASYQKQFGQEINSDIQQMKEKITFEYVIYDSSSQYLNATILNCGTANNITIANVYVNGLKIQSSDYTFGRLRAGSALYLNRGDEGLLTINIGSPTVPSSLKNLQAYTVTIVTGRNSNFVGTT
jgi:hypothetical protein